MNSNIKRTLSLVLAALMCTAALSACASDAGKTDPAVTTAAPIAEATTPAETTAPVTEDDRIHNALDYIGDADKAVAYIDISVFWSSGYDAEVLKEEILKSSDFESAEVLYQNGLSTTYLFSK